MADTYKIQEYIRQVEGLLAQMKLALADAPAGPAPAQQPPRPVVAAQSAPADGEDLGSFEALKRALLSDKWPEAVNPNLICDPASETDKVERGRGIIELMIEEDLKGLKLLDFGCGEGHCVRLAGEYGAAAAVGYDVAPSPAWASAAGAILTADFAEVQRHGPYNVVVLFDVLDHLTGEDPVSVLAKVRSVLADGGKVYVRTHPFTSRHATHLYHRLNKAYVHLVFTPEELAHLVPDPPFREPTARVVTPLKTYNDAFEQAGLKVASRRDITEKVEPFFKIPKVAERIVRTVGFYPDFQMTLQFNDFVLTK